MKESFKRLAVVATLVVGLVGVLAPSAGAGHSSYVLQCPQGEFHVEAKETGTWFEAPPNSFQILKGENTNSVFIIAEILRNGQPFAQRTLGGTTIPAQSHTGLVERSNVELVTCTLVRPTAVFQLTGIMTPAP